MTLSRSDSGLVTISALFERKDQAEAARADLIAYGTAPDRIDLIETPEAAAAVEPAHSESLLEKILDVLVFLPDDDRISYAEAVRRGAVALCVRIEPNEYERVIDRLDRHGALALDERKRDAGTVGAAKGVDPARLDPAERHDPLVNPAANPDMRERIGVGTASMMAGVDPAPDHAATAVEQAKEGRLPRPTPPTAAPAPEPGPSPIRDVTGRGR